MEEGLTLTNEINGKNSPQVNTLINLFYIKYIEQYNDFLLKLCGICNIIAMIFMQKGLKLNLDYLLLNN